MPTFFSHDIILIMEKEIKLIVCDIDGTILPNGKKEISERLRVDLHRAMDKGIKVMINTGRHYTFLPHSLFEDLPMDRIGTINGACLVDREGKPLYKHPMSEQVMNDFITYSDLYHIGLGFKFEDAVVSYANSDIFLKGYVGDDEERRKLVIDDATERKHHESHGYPLGTFIICDERTVEPLREKMPEIVFAWSQKNGFDAFLNTITKADSIEPVLQEYGFTWDNVIAFGDAGNDTPMIQKAGIGVALGNAKDDVKDYADIVADTCINDGVAKVLEDLNLA